MNLKSQRFLILPVCLALASNLSAGVLPIVNGSFESETIDNPNGNEINNQATYQPSGIFTGWGASSFTNSYGSVSNSTALFTAGLTGVNSYRPKGNAFQSTGHTFTAGITYTLSVDVGRVTGAATSSGMEFGFRNSADSAYVGSLSFVDNQSIPAGTFQTFTISYTAQPADQGNAINIRLSDYYTDNTDLRIDNVRLSDDSTGPAATLTVLTSSRTSSVSGVPVTFTASVSSDPNTPDGAVTFYDGASSLGAGTLNGSGTATLTTSGLSTGAHSITATYTGNSNFTPSSSAVLNVTVLESINLDNQSFEEGNGYLGGETLNADALPGWQMSGSVYGNVNNVTGQFTSGLSGSNALYINGGRLEQLTAATFEAGRTYTLTFDVGNPLPASGTASPNGFNFGFRNEANSGYRAGRFVNGVTVFAIPAGTFQGFSVTHTATEEDDGDTIRIAIEDYYSPIFYRVDNVTLGVSPVIATGYATWAAGYGLPAGSDLTDSDFDGISNLLEYAQNSSPVSNLSGTRPSVTITADGGSNYLTLATVKNPTASDLTYTVESSGDLLNWSAEQTVILTATTTTLVVRDSLAQTAQTKRFLRLRVNR